MASYSTFTIAGSATTSNALLLGGRLALTQIEFPSGFTGTNVAIYGSVDGTNYRAVYMDGTAQTITYGASQTHSINPRVTYGLHSVKLVSNGTEAAVRTILAITERVI